MRITVGQLRKIIREEIVRENEVMAPGGNTARIVQTVRNMNRGRDLQDLIAYYGDATAAATAMIRRDVSFMDSRTHGPNAGLFLNLGKAASEEGITAEALAEMLSA